MSVASSRFTFWPQVLPQNFGIRLGRNLSYLDTLQFVDNTATTVKFDCVINGKPTGPTAFYIFCAGAGNWYSLEIMSNSLRPYFNMGSSTILYLTQPQSVQYGQRYVFNVATGNGQLTVSGDWTLSRSYSGSVQTDRTLTIGATVNRHLEEGLYQTIKASLEAVRIDITLYSLMIYKGSLLTLNLVPAIKAGKPCFKDLVSQNYMFSSGLDPFEIVEG